MILVWSQTRRRQVEGCLFKVGVDLIENHGAALGEDVSHVLIGYSL